MFKKTNRLAKTRDVRQALARGRSFFNPFFTLKFLKAPLPGAIRITVVVSTKVSKKAVVRNQLKRQVREFMRLRLRFLQAGDYAILVRPAAVKASREQLLTKLSEGLSSARLLTTQNAKI